jgi:predicted transcriptional regulator
MTQREFFKKAIAIFNEVENEEMKAYAETAIEKLDARNAKKSSTPSKTQVENEEIKGKILEYLVGKTDSISSVIGLALGYSTSKISALMKQLADEGKVTVTDVKIPKKGKVKGYTLTEAEIGEVEAE